MKLKGKTALVTGGSSGLGLSVAKLLLKKGMKVAICGRTEKTLIEAAEKLDSGDLQIFVCDVREHEQVEQMVGQIGKIDVLINNAGIWFAGDLEDYSYEKIDEMVDTNLKGLIFVTRAVLPVMRENEEGYIVNVSSTSGVRAKKHHNVYTATKYGVRGFTDALKFDVFDSKIKVIGFYPGGMDTNLFKNAGKDDEVPSKDWMDPDKVAEIIVFMMERDETMVMDHVVLNRGS